MFGLSFTELLLIGIVALVVLGPERLPKAARTLGEWIGKCQRLAANIKSELANQADYAELAKLKNEISQATQELHDGIQEFEQHLAQEKNTINQQLHRPAWERLPEQRTPADFGITETHISADYLLPKLSGLHTQSLNKQAMHRKRDLRPRYRPKPKLRSRR